MDSASTACNTSKQNITFNGNDRENLVPVVSEDVIINCSDGNHNHGSSNVCFTSTIVNFNWNFRYYMGQLVAAHIGGNYYAYALKTKGVGMIRVSNHSNKQSVLIKDLKGEILDLAFALIPKQVVLGCVNDGGTLFVYDVIETGGKTICSLILNIIHPSAASVPIKNYRVIWCPYVPYYQDDCDVNDDPAKLLTFLNDNKAEVWDVSIASKKYGREPIAAKQGLDGFIETKGHSAEVIDASFSPDGTALATASLDGYVKFFQIYMLDDEEPRCLHEWQPHKGKGLSCLLFLDNVHDSGPDSRFWKFAVTGCCHNSELKIWSCETWACLQTIHFQPNPKSVVNELFFKVSLDSSGQYLLMSEINNRLFYILQVQKRDAEQIAMVSSVSELLLPAPFLSYAIIDANLRKIRYTNSSEDLYREDHEDYDDESFVSAVVIKLFVVQPKTFQECVVTFQPDKEIYSTNGVFAKILENKQKDVASTSEIENEAAEAVVEDIVELNNLHSPTSLLIQQTTQLNLMTPDAFNSPIQNSSPNGIRNDLNSSLNASLEKLKENEENLIDFQRPQKENFASGGSSPSREVQEILALTPAYNNQEYFDNIKIDNDNEIQQNDEDLIFTEDIKEVVWPSIPIVKADEIIKEENRMQEIRLGAPAESTEKNANQSIENRLEHVEELLVQQNSQIQQLLLALNMKNEIVKEMQSFYSKELEVALSKNQMHFAKLFENYINVQKSKEYEQREHLVTGISQFLFQQLSEKLQSFVIQEIKLVVLPAVKLIFENLKHQLDMQYSQKLNSIDHLLKDNLSKLVNNKSMADSLSLSVMNMIKPNLEVCYRDMISTILIPSWEPVCNTMFQQIHDTFTQGTKEYTASVENYMDRQRRVQDKCKDLIMQMQDVSETMKINADKLTNNLSQEVQKQINTSLMSMQERMCNNIAEVVGEQIKQAFKKHASVIEDSVINAVRSRSVTPSPNVIDTQVLLGNIKQFLAKGMIDIAFQQALSAAELSLVVYVCEKVDVQEVFRPEGCILQQHVLLSLIQQLSADLANHTELKHKYLEEAVLNVVVSYPDTKQHVPIVLKELYKQLTGFIQTNPSHKSAKNFKVLQMAVRSLLKN